MRCPGPWLQCDVAPGPALSLDRINGVLPGDRRWHRHIDGDLEVRVGSADVQAALVAHPAQYRIEIMHAAFGLAKRLIHLDM
jgi:hypothetical protein